MSELDLRLWFRGGWCRLSLTADTTIEIRTHWLADGFIELVHAVQDLLDGRRTVAVRWAHEIGGGHFLDLVRGPDDGLALAVHELTDGPHDRSAASLFGAERGPCVFRAQTTTARLVVLVAQNLHRVRLRDVDPSTGMVEQWPRTFPTAAHERLEQEAVARYGYRPLFRVELDHEDPA